MTETQNKVVIFLLFEQNKIDKFTCCQFNKNFTLDRQPSLFLTEDAVVPAVIQATITDYFCSSYKP